MTEPSFSWTLDSSAAAALLAHPVRCIHTGLAVPECSCPPCTRGLIERHAPHLLENS